MRRHAKASSAGSSSATGASRGLRRRAFATRGASNDANGSGAPSLRLLATLALAISALLAFAATPALARDLNAFTEIGSFAGNGSGPGGSGSEDGQLSDPGQADILTSTGKLYVADTANNRVEVFKPNATGGEYDSQVAITAPTGLAIDQDSGDVYVANATGITKFDSALNPIVVGWTDPAVTGALTVDPSTGDLLVADLGANLIRRFESDGTAAGSFAAERPLDLAASSSGEIFVVTSTGDLFTCATSAVQRFSAAGVAEATVGADLVAPSAISVDPSDDSIAIAVGTNSYRCNGTLGIALLSSTGVVVRTLKLNGDATYATVPGLAWASFADRSSRVYAVTKSPADDNYGATKVTALATPPLFAPTIAPNQSVSPTQHEGAITGKINPGNDVTKYHVEYGTSTAYGQSTPEQSTPAGGNDATVKVNVSGLTPGQSYHFRLVASNSVGDAEGADQTFTTLVGSAADSCLNCRVYEQVSPADKNGYPVFWKPQIGDAHPLINIGLSAAARDGETAVFTSWGVFAASQNSLIQSYRSRRTGSGWVTTPGAPGLNSYHPDGVGNPAISAWRTGASDLREGLINTSNSWSPLDTNTFTDVQNAGASDLYLRNASDETLLMSADNTDSALGRIYPNGYMTMARDGGHVLFSHATNVYERAGGVTRLVSEAPGGGPADPECGSSLIGGPYATNAGAAGNSQSSDGSKVLFQTSGPEGGVPTLFCENFFVERQLFVRIDGTRTVPISESQRSEPDPAGGIQTPYFVGASEDLSRIFFVSQKKLTDDADALPGAYLYEFDLDSEHLSAVGGGIDESSIRNISADGSSIYFMRGPSLYRLSDGEETLITTSPTGSIGPINPGAAISVASEDGNTLLFIAAQNLTDYDSHEHDEAYLYREGEPLRCISCGSRSTVPSHAHISLGGEALSENEAGRYASSLSADGSIATFDTDAALLPADTNNRRDVYEYDAETEKLALVTDGKSPNDFYLYGMSRSARDVFFVTNASVVSQDVDGGDEDLYDARRGGGFPAGEGEAKLECGGETCQAPASTQPTAAKPASAQLSGAGNEKARQRARCRKPRQGKKKAQAKKARCASTKKHHKKAKGNDRRASARQSHGKGR